MISAAPAYPFSVHPFFLSVIAGYGYKTYQLTYASAVVTCVGYLTMPNKMTNHALAGVCFANVYAELAARCEAAERRT